MPQETDPLFAGTARYYSEFRPSYPTLVFDLLTAEAPLEATSRVLDIGCGTGLLTLTLAERAASVTGVDPDLGMLDEAARLANKRGQHNIRWVLSVAERFDDKPGGYRLVVIGSAFHWMDRPVVAAKAHELLEHEGLFAVLGNPSPLMLTQPGGDRLVREDVGTAVAAAVTAVQDRWFQPKKHSERTGSLTRPEEVIRASPFGVAMLLSVPTRQEWDIPSLLGFLRSTSLRPDQVLGSRFQEFANEVEQAVLSIEPTGHWVYENSVEVILARR
jgi:2-polyprenyl-3-methyl-5-hydroxy-6-metoxy-1,4-benzoquinol methylase